MWGIRGTGTSGEVTRNKLCGSVELGSIRFIFSGISERHRSQGTFPYCLNEGVPFECSVRRIVPVRSNRTCVISIIEYMMVDRSAENQCPYDQLSLHGPRLPSNCLLYAGLSVRSVPERS